MYLSAFHQNEPKALYQASIKALLGPTSLLSVLGPCTHFPAEEAWGCTQVLTPLLGPRGQGRLTPRQAFQGSRIPGSLPRFVGADPDDREKRQT